MIVPRAKSVTENLMSPIFRVCTRVAANAKAALSSPATYRHSTIVRAVSRASEDRQAIRQQRTSP